VDWNTEASPAVRASRRLLAGLARAEPSLERRLQGRAWVPLSVLAALLVACLFSTPGFGWRSAVYERYARRNFRPAVELQIERPLSDMSRAFPAWTNQAKRTFRITAPAVALVTRSGVPGAVLFELLCGYAALHAAALLGERLLGSRSAGFSAALLLASNYFGTAALKDALFWFDSVAYGLLMLSMTASSPALRALAVCAACFTDERALLVLPLTLWRWGDDAPGLGAFRSEVAATGAGAAAYLVLRIALRAAFGLRTATEGIGHKVLASQHASQLVACLWSPFEGAWLLVAVGCFVLLRQAGPGRRAAAAGLAYFAAYLAACFLVVDVTRSMSFAFVGVFPLLAALARRLGQARVRTLLLLAALVSLAAPNIFVWYDITYEVGPLWRLLAIV
jgi:hypothetical protein